MFETIHLQCRRNRSEFIPIGSKSCVQCRQGLREYAEHVITYVNGVRFTEVITIHSIMHAWEQFSVLLEEFWNQKLFLSRTEQSWKYWNSSGHCNENVVDLSTFLQCDLS